ncbi:MAG: aminotransferase class III-fold pyridoxal phosphate-dependent enzyme [Alphaproteobacteria bacterium]|nr:aminotransferase class III-fold pyridoxal phosphate-dependent enzyme [Alphaproteobacteria bacterium]
MARQRLTPNDLDAFWLPFTPNRHFKKEPRLLVRARGLHYYDAKGRALLDACSGLWCVNAGHGRDTIAAAVAEAARELDFAPSFQFAHPDAFHLAQRLTAMAPDGLDHVFFVNSGSEAADSALKLARAYHVKRGEGQRFRLIGRSKGYHGVTFGGLSVGGIANNRKPYGPLLPGTDDHLPLPYDPAHMAFTRGEPQEGASYAQALRDLVNLHGAETIAAVIVEPMAGSAGVFASPSGYLKELRALCDQYGILLIFDEVITGFGRLGFGFAAERYGVTPDIITFAKGVTNGVVPMGGMIVAQTLYDAFMDGPEHSIEFVHGHTYSAHPLACAAALATLDIYRDEDLFARARTLAPVLEEAVHDLKDAPGVIDIRNVGLAAAIDLEPDPKAPGRRGYDVMRRAFHEHDVVVRVSGDTIALAPALVAEAQDIVEMTRRLAAALSQLT